MADKPGLPRGTRDFGVAVMSRRNYIFDTIKGVYRKFGFLPLETPTMENLSVLTGKYGDEGDQLIFKILNSGNFTEGLNPADWEEGYKKLTPKISEKALRYDLTVPFARYVAMNRNDIAFPFKRYQIQPVWRADRPQKGRYREFYQCDADVVGTESLLCEAEIILMIKEALGNLGLTDYTIKVNNRKILAGIAEAAGAPGREAELCVAIDKLDKIGQAKVEEELLQRGFTAENVAKLQPVFVPANDTLTFLKSYLAASETGQKGLEELEAIYSYLNLMGSTLDNVVTDASLARGLSYYTGAILEVKVNNVSIGSICGGGRYDNLTGLFGLPGVSGVGISFGVDRIYDVLEELKLFPESVQESSQVLFAQFSQESLAYTLPLLTALRHMGIAAEVYPDAPKLKKQFAFADAKNIPWVAIAGPDELAAGNITLRNMKTGQQVTVAATINAISEVIGL